jgi:hypothetical protein
MIRGVPTRSVATYIADPLKNVNKLIHFRGFKVLKAPTIALPRNATKFYFLFVILSGSAVHPKNVYSRGLDLVVIGFDRLS